MTKAEILSTIRSLRGMGATQVSVCGVCATFQEKRTREESANEAIQAGIERELNEFRERVIDEREVGEVEAGRKRAKKSDQLTYLHS